MSLAEYREFIATRAVKSEKHGFTPDAHNSHLKAHQRAVVDFALDRGKSAGFLDTGLGKSLIELEFAKQCADETGKPSLILTPLAVAGQMVREGQKFGIDARQIREQSEVGAGVMVANYERLPKLDPASFGAVVLDESSILKNYDGATKQAITDFMRKTEYRLLATATAAPNDYIELGTSAEALGYMGFIDMLGRFFKNDQNNVSMKRIYGEAPKWRFKGHAELPFWRWVTSWARACRKPSDLGFDDGPFILPGLIENEVLIDTKSAPDGMLFNLPASTLPEQRMERKRTINDRCEAAADLVHHNRSAVVWCHMNDEGDLLQKLIPGSVQVSGRDSDDAKEAKFEAFGRGDARVMITKPKIGALGLNWQHADHVVYFPSHSYEQYYQAVRRCWRFGQKNDVTVDIVMTEGERRVMANLQQKSVKADTMFANLVAEMNRAAGITKVDHYTQKTEMPKWL